MRICSRCRQPVSRDARDHDCPAEDEAESSSEEEPGAPVPDFYKTEVYPDTGNVNCYFG
jgi:hypothetical protein